jgi:hypothetical protein
MVLLAAFDLAILGIHLWPWQEIVNLPGNGTVAFDPIICLAVLVGLIPWISSGIKEPTAKALAAGAMTGVVAGVVLVANVVLESHGSGQSGFLRPALLGIAAILWGVAGLRGSRAAGNAGMGALAGMWGAIVSSLMACAAVLGQFYLTAPGSNSPDPWKEYQGLAIGNTAMQELVHTLNTATGFLLIGPLAGAAVGLIFAFFGQGQKS